ncbi:Hpt domain-containing protein [Marinimicrobium sp. ABcell2]|uniref:Hpt domain-containing protein n=1 Tax=Marinimicrobium sp. ABcell2 TaxID=3069751 RepID=UPI0027B22B05|nr:Hpt domain-containing protein [Marinimicrobium sp. ABcell2]MDQ2078090.1 Hpt domain-containing protein [Marinimicrobium sp. ABcell2]
MNSENHLDREVLQTLQEIMGDEFPVLITTFINDSDERIRSLQKALATQNSDALQRSAHSFKGSCHNLGAKYLATLCEHMEHRGREGELEGLECHLVDIQQEFSQIKSILRSFTG